MSNEERYQDVLVPATRGRDLGVRGYPVLADLVLAPGGNPSVKKATGPVVEVRLGDRTVGYLTPAMSARYSRLVDRAQREGKRLTSNALLGEGTKAGQNIVEIQLLGVPRALDERVVNFRDITVTPGHVFNRRTGTTHVIREQHPDGSFRTGCGLDVPRADAIVYGSTQPWVGMVIFDSREVVEGYEGTICGRC